jgi:hypothetical protein
LQKNLIKRNIFFVKLDLIERDGGSIFFLVRTKDGFQQSGRMNSEQSKATMCWTINADLAATFFNLGCILKWFSDKIPSSWFYNELFYQSLVGPVLIDAELGRDDHNSIPHNSDQKGAGSTCYQNWPWIGLNWWWKLKKYNELCGCIMSFFEWLLDIGMDLW